MQQQGQQVAKAVSIIDQYTPRCERLRGKAGPSNSAGNGDDSIFRTKVKKDGLMLMNLAGSWCHVTPAEAPLGQNGRLEARLASSNFQGQIVQATGMRGTTYNNL